MRCRLFCLLGLFGVLASGDAAAAADAGCTYPAQRFAPGATVCEVATGSQGMEPMLAVNGRGTMFMGIATTSTRTPTGCSSPLSLPT